MPADQLTGGRGFPDHQPTTTFPNPWPGGAWKLRDIVDYDLSAARGLIGAAARYREDLVRNFYRMAKRQVELGTKGGPFAFIIPPDQFDAHAARKLEQLLIDGAVELRRTLEPFRVADTVYSEGADIILMAQPNRAYAKTLLEVQQYPVRRVAGAQVDRPYDVAGWTLPLQMNVRVDRIDQYFEPPPTTRIDRATIAPAKVWGDVRKPSFFVIDGRGNGASIAINRLLKAGAPVSFLSSAMPILGYTYQPGAVMVMDGKGVRESVEAIARDLGLRATASSRPAADGRAAARPCHVSASTSRASRTPTRAGHDGCSNSTSSSSTALPTPTSGAAACARASTRSCCPTRMPNASWPATSPARCRPNTSAASEATAPKR